MLCVLGLAFLFGYISVYADLTSTGYSKSKLVEMCRQERIKNQQLKVELNRLSSPHNIVLAARGAGMVYATEYEYLPKSESVASVTDRPAVDAQQPYAGIDR